MDLDTLPKPIAACVAETRRFAGIALCLAVLLFLIAWFFVPHGDAGKYFGVPLVLVSFLLAGAAVGFSEASKDFRRAWRRYAIQCQRTRASLRLSRRGECVPFDPFATEPPNEEEPPLC